MNLKIKKRNIVFICATAVLITISAFFLLKGNNEPAEAYYFVFNPCGSCSDTDEFAEEIFAELYDEALQNNKTLNIRLYNAFKSEAAYMELCEKHGIEPERRWPALIIGNKSLAGINDIRENARKTLRDYIRGR